jgi:peptide chain release factor 1
MDDAQSQPAPDLLLIVEAHEGGVEALPAAYDLVQMYTRYALRRGWALVCLEADSPAPGQIRRAVYAIAGAATADRLRYEPGIHRVQRLSFQTALRRIHTATVIVQLMQLADTDGSSSQAVDAPPLALPKIRTYTYAENRVTDHRLGQNVAALPLLLDGDLDPLIDALEQGDHGTH